MKKLLVFLLGLVLLGCFEAEADSLVVLKPRFGAPPAAEDPFSLEQYVVPQPLILAERDQAGNVTGREILPEEIANLLAGQYSRVVYYATQAVFDNALINVEQCGKAAVAISGVLGVPVRRVNMVPDPDTLAGENPAWIKCEAELDGYVNGERKPFVMTVRPL